MLTVEQADDVRLQGLWRGAGLASYVIKVVGYA
jgi:hypothetical protein